MLTVLIFSSEQYMPFEIFLFFSFHIPFCSICLSYKGGNVMNKVQFDLDTLKHIRNKLDYIYSIAKNNYNDNPELMDTIENLAQVANMFASIKIQEMTDEDNHVKTPSPQGYILSKLANPYSRMKEYEKRKEEKFPPWKL